MILNRKEASYYLAANFEDIRGYIQMLESQSNFAGVLQAIVNYFNQLLALGDVKRMIAYLRPIVHVYQKGDQYIQFLVENLFVRSFAGIKKRSSMTQWNSYYKKMPSVLKRLHETINENHTNIK